MDRKRKKKIAVLSATGCHACENAILDINYQVLSLVPWVEIAYWPYLLGTEEGRLDSMDDIDVCFFSGAIHTDEERIAAERLRRKAGLLVACGACASFGGLPALIDLGNAGGRPHQKEVNHPQDGSGTPTLPEPAAQVLALDQVVPVDYMVPGCPPTQSILWAAIQALVCGPKALARISFTTAVFSPEVIHAVTHAVLPPRGSVFAGQKAVCAGCARAKEEKKIQGALAGNSCDAAAERCLLEQGVLCMGLVTQEGCGGICPSAGVPCRGCFGKLSSIKDPGAKAIAAIGSTLDSHDASEIERWISGLQDLSGTFYRYTYATQCMLKPLQSDNPMEGPARHASAGGV